MQRPRPQNSGLAYALSGTRGTWQEIDETGARGRNVALEFEMTRDLTPISRHEHWSTPARSGPPPDRRSAPAPPRPPRWRPWLLLIGVFFTLSLLADTMSTRNPTVESLSYTTFEHDVTAIRVKAATISPTGGVTGALSGGAHYSSQIPTVPPQDALAALLSEHNVDVTATSPSSGGVSVSATSSWTSFPSRSSSVSSC